MKKTHLAYPWALIAWGGVEVGKRPRTKMALLTDTRDGKFRAFTLMSEAPIRLAQKGRWISRDEVHGRWHEYPSEKEIRDARKSLPIIDESNVYS